MTRDMDLIRELLLELESFDAQRGAIYSITGENFEGVIKAFSNDQIAYHLDLLREAGFVESPGSQPMDGITFRRLTWTGHDFIDAVRNPEVWAKTKKGAMAAGGFTLDLLKDLAKGLLKTQIEERTGIKL